MQIIKPIIKTKPSARIIFALSSSKNNLNTSEIARKLNIAQSSAWIQINRLHQENFIKKHENKTFSINYEVIIEEFLKYCLKYTKKQKHSKKTLSVIERNIKNWKENKYLHNLFYEALKRYTVLSEASTNFIKIPKTLEELFKEVIFGFFYFQKRNFMLFCKKDKELEPLFYLTCLFQETTRTPISKLIDYVFLEKNKKK